MNFFKRNTFFSIVFLCSFYVYPMKRTFTVPNSAQNVSKQNNSEEKKIHNIPVDEYFCWLKTRYSHNSLSKKDRDNILELAEKDKISLEEATAHFLREKRSNQGY